MLRAASTASRSTPAETVTSLAGGLSFLRLILAAGLALAAAQPQTEFTTTRVVPSPVIAFSTASAVYSSSNPAEARSSRMGFTNSAGYIAFLFYVMCKGTKSKEFFGVFDRGSQRD
jgi:hypothetical protein